MHYYFFVFYYSNLDYRICKEENEPGAAKGSLFLTGFLQRLGSLRDIALFHFPEVKQTEGEPAGHDDSGEAEEGDRSKGDD